MLRKANAKANLGECICLSIAKATANKISRFSFVTVSVWMVLSRRFLEGVLQWVLEGRRVLRRNFREGGRNTPFREHDPLPSRAPRKHALRVCWEAKNKKKKKLNERTLAGRLHIWIAARLWTCPICTADIQRKFL